jgi:putative endonuclease
MVLGSSTRTTAQALGDRAERVAAEGLEAAGWRVLARNLHVGRSELDLLAVDPGPPARLVVVEVRWRRTRGFGAPEETVDWRKLASLRAGLLRLLDAGRLPDGSSLPRLPAAVDVVVVEPAEEPGATRTRHLRDVLETD